MAFVKAQRSAKKARIALMGPSNSGKTFTALQIAKGLGSRIAVIDTEAGAASLYGDHVDFDVDTLSDYAPRNYVNKINEAVKAGYDVIVIDSLSHAWAGKGGCLEMIDGAGGNKFSNGWSKVTPMHNELVEAVLQCPIHIVCTMRSKMDYVVETVNGKAVPRKVGLGAVQRDGIEYEFDVIGSMDANHILTVTKSRFPELSDKTYECPDSSLGKAILGEVSRGVIAPKVIAPVAVDQLPPELQDELPEADDLPPAVEPAPAAMTVEQIKDAWLKYAKQKNLPPLQMKQYLCQHINGYTSTTDMIANGRANELLEHMKREGFVK